MKKSIDNLTKDCTPSRTDSIIQNLKEMNAEQKFTEDFRMGLHRGFNYALAMIKEELGDDFFVKNKFNKMLVSYYTELMNIGIKERFEQMLKNEEVK